MALRAQQAQLLIQTNGFGSAPRLPGKFTYVHMTLLPDPAPARSLLAVAGCCPGAHGVHAESVSGTATGRKRPKAVNQYLADSDQLGRHNLMGCL
jgi:hypothetical protein